MSAPPQEIERLWHASDEELLGALGGALLGEQIGFAPEDGDRLGRFADRWLSERWARIRELLCGDPRLRAALAGSLGDRMLEAAVVADALATLAGHPATSVLAVIVLRRGGAALCDALD